jgi:hypothetical protein
MKENKELCSLYRLQSNKQDIPIKRVAKYLYTIGHIHSRKHQICILTIINIQSPTFLSNLHNTTQQTVRFLLPRVINYQIQMQKTVDTIKLYLNHTADNNVTNLRFVPDIYSLDSINKQKHNN